MRLMLCAGEQRREGWKTLDARESKGLDVLATIPPLPPEVTGEKWDEIEWIHGIEVLYYWQVEETLRQLRAALNPDGVLVLEQPDAQQGARKILEDDSFVWWMFGKSDYCDPLNMNRWAYTPESLTRALRVAGFTRIEVLPAQHHSPVRDFRVEARP